FWWQKLVGGRAQPPGRPPYPARPARRRFRPLLEILEDRTLPAAFTVNDLGDAATGQGQTGDLRYCVNQANLTPVADTISFAPNVLLQGNTIPLTSGELPI